MQLSITPLEQIRFQESLGGWSETELQWQQAIRQGFSASIYSIDMATNISQNTCLYR